MRSDITRLSRRKNFLLLIEFRLLWDRLVQCLLVLNIHSRLLRLFLWQFFCHGGFLNDGSFLCYG